MYLNEIKLCFVVVVNGIDISLHALCTFIYETQKLFFFCSFLEKRKTKKKPS